MDERWEPILFKPRSFEESVEWFALGGEATCVRPILRQIFGVGLGGSDKPSFGRFVGRFYPTWIGVRGWMKQHQPAFLGGQGQRHVAVTVRRGAAGGDLKLGVCSRRSPVSLAGEVFGGPVKVMDCGAASEDGKTQG